MFRAAAIPVCLAVLVAFREAPFEHFHAHDDAEHVSRDHGLNSAARLAIAGILSTGMGRSFLPEFNEGTLTISAVTMPGTSLAQSDELGRSLERILLGVPEVVATARRTGRTELDVNLKMKERSKHDVLEDIRRRVTLLPGMNVTIGQPISHRIDHMLSGTRANVAVKIFGDDLPALRALASQVQSVMQEVDGVVDLSTEQQTEVPTVRVRMDRAALARYGLGAGAASEALQTAFVGSPVGQILEGQVAFPLVVRYGTDDLSDSSRRQRLT